MSVETSCPTAGGSTTSRPQQLWSHNLVCLMALELIMWPEPTGRVDAAQPRPRALTWFNVTAGDLSRTNFSWQYRGIIRPVLRPRHDQRSLACGTAPFCRERDHSSRAAIIGSTRCRVALCRGDTVT